MDAYPTSDFVACVSEKDQIESLFLPADTENQGVSKTKKGTARPFERQG